MIAAGISLVKRERALIGAIEETARRQREIAGRVEVLTGQTVERLDVAAHGAGRIASTASIVRTIAKRAVDRAGF